MTRYIITVQCTWLEVIISHTGRTHLMSWQIRLMEKKPRLFIFSELIHSIIILILNRYHAAM